MFSPVNTTKIRVLVTQALNSWSRIAEVEALGTAVVTTPPTSSTRQPVGRCGLHGTCDGALCGDGGRC